MIQIKLEDTQIAVPDIVSVRKIPIKDRFIIRIDSSASVTTTTLMTDEEADTFMDYVLGLQAEAAAVAK